MTIGSISLDSVAPAADRDRPLDPAALTQLFLGARTYDRWQDRPLAPGTLEALQGLMRWGPTSMNCQPARLAFVVSAEAKERLRPCLMQGNVDQTMSAPATVIIATDPRFHDRMPDLWPGGDVRDMFETNNALRESTAFRNGTLQGAYLILAARALGLDCGPMSGFDPAKVSEAFLAGEGWEANFLCNLGYGDPQGLFPRAPRPAFDEVARVV